MITLESIKTILIENNVEVHSTSSRDKKIATYLRCISAKKVNDTNIFAINIDKGRIKLTFYKAQTPYEESCESEEILLLKIRELGLI